MRTGVRLEPNGNYWRAVWTDSKGKRQRKNVGVKKSRERPDGLTKREAIKACDKLAADMLLNPSRRERMHASKLRAFLEDYRERRVAGGKVSAGALANDSRTAELLLEHFGPSITLDKITPAAADDWALWLESKKGPGLAPVTAAGHVRRARTLLKNAIRRGEAPSNPFEFVQVVVAPVVHETWVRADMIEPLLGACPGPAWRALMALCIFTGCRRSEALALEWGAVKWGEAKIVMPNIKTRQSTGATTRTVRMEPELERILLECQEAAEGALVAPVMELSLDHAVRRVYKRAGIDVVSDPFKVWRRWRSDEWERVGFPRAVVRQWIGNSEAVAAKHYDGVAPQFYGEASPLQALEEARAKIAELMGKKEQAT